MTPSRPSKPQVNAGTVVYPAVKRCIYCDAIWGDFGREHIIPFSLGGSFILHAASCPCCAAIINEEVEQPLLKIMFGALRARFNLPTRKGRPDTTPVIFGKEVANRFEESDSREIPNLELPMTFLGLELGAPGILLGHKPSNVFNGRMWIKANEADIVRLTDGTGDGFRAASIHPLLFCRLLAKIAHSYAVAELGYQNFRPLLKGLILGRSDTPCHWIGGGNISEKKELGLHRLRCDMFRSRTGVTYHGVNIRLFAPHGAPENNIIVGESLENQLSVLQKIRDTEPVKFFLPLGKFIPRTKRLCRIGRWVKSLRFVKLPRKQHESAP